MITIKETNKSKIYQFDGYSHGYNAYVQGAFVGKFIVPKKYAGMVREGLELDDLREMRKYGRFGVVLRDGGIVQ